MYFSMDLSFVPCLPWHGKVQETQGGHAPNYMILDHKWDLTESQGTGILDQTDLGNWIGRRISSSVPQLEVCLEKMQSLDPSS